MKAQLAVFVLAITATACLPSDPLPPIGLANATGDEPVLLEDIAVLYALCDDERVREISVTSVDEVGDVDGQLVWHWKGRPLLDTEDGSGVAEIELDSNPDGFVNVPLGGSPSSAGLVLLVEVETTLFSGGSYFDIGRLDGSDVLVDQMLLSRGEFGQQYACENHRR